MKIKSLGCALGVLALVGNTMFAKPNKNQMMQEQEPVLDQQPVLGRAGDLITQIVARARLDASDEIARAQKKAVDAQHAAQEALHDLSVVKHETANKLQHIKSVSKEASMDFSQEQKSALGTKVTTYQRP